MVPSALTGGSWMGSHVTNDDLVQQSRLADDFAGRVVLNPVIHCKLTFAATAKLVALVFGATLAMGLWPMRRVAKVLVATSLRTQR